MTVVTRIPALGNIANTTPNAVVSATAANAATQGIGVATGLQKKLDWAGEVWI